MLGVRLCTGWAGHIILTSGSIAYLLSLRRCPNYRFAQSRGHKDPARRKCPLQFSSAYLPQNCVHYTPVPSIYLASRHVAPHPGAPARKNVSNTSKAKYFIWVVPLEFSLPQACLLLLQAAHFAKVPVCTTRFSIAHFHPNDSQRLTVSLTAVIT